MVNVRMLTIMKPGCNTEQSPIGAENVAGRLFVIGVVLGTLSGCSLMLELHIDAVSLRGEILPTAVANEVDS